MRNTKRAWSGALAAAAVGWLAAGLAVAAEADERSEEVRPPKVGQKARGFELESIRGGTVRLAERVAQGPVVLVVLRGYPGYQCPICTRQFGDFLRHADAIAEAGARAVMVYPGPAEKLKDYAKQFVGDRTLPEHYELVVDPDFAFTKAYGLRWEAPNETAYPSTFVIDSDSMVRFAKVSRSHGGRATAAEVLAALKAMRKQAASERTEPSDAALSERVDDILRRVRSHRFHPIRDGFTYDRRLDKHGVADPEDEDWRVRLLALRDLARLGAPGAPAAERIAAHLRDENPHVRQVSAMALGILGHGPAVDDLQRLLREDEDTVVRSQAAISLGRLGDEAALGLLQERAENDPSRDVRHQCRLAAYRISHGIGAEVDLAAAYASLDESRFGRVEVGRPAPDFELEDTGGRTWRLSEQLGEGPVVLIWIFADWCPVCHNEFRELIELREAFERRGVKVFTLEAHDRYRARVMVGAEAVRPEYWFADRPPQDVYAGQVWWPHLVDPAGKVGAMYGVDPLQFVVHSEWINRPATVIIDREGVVRFAYYGTYWGDRPSIEKTLQMAAERDYEFEHPRRLKPSPGAGGSEGRPSR